MIVFNFVYVFVVAVCSKVVLSTEETAEDYQERSNIEKPVGRSYSITRCDYTTQIGYSCASCHRALHCYPGNVALLVDCYGRFRFCRDGRCSRYQGEKCLSDNSDTKLTTANPALNDTKQTSVITTNADATTSIVSEAVTEVVTETVSLPIDPIETTKSDVSTTKKDMSSTISDVSSTMNDVSSTINDLSSTVSEESSTKSDATTTKREVSSTISDLSSTISVVG